MPHRLDIFSSLTEEEQILALASVMPLKFGAKTDASDSTQPTIKLREFFPAARKPREYLVDGLIGRGHLALLSGRPKSGKSWLVMQLAMAVDNGAPFLGRPTRQGPIFYAALEDGEDRIHERGQLLGWNVRSDSEGRFVLPAFSAPNGSLGPGLEEVAKLSSRFDLILIDTLAATLNCRINENDNAAMGAIVNELAHIAHTTGCAILVVHHTAKGFSEEDKFTGVRGASAIRAAYDVGLLLEHKAGEDEGVLRVESRDADVEGMTIRKVKDGVGWELVGPSEEIIRIRAGRKVIEALEDLSSATLDELAEYMGVGRSPTYRQLVRAERDGIVVKVEGGKATGGRPAVIYTLKGHTLQEESTPPAGDEARQRSLFLAGLVPENRQ